MNVWPKPSELTPEQIQHLIVYGENPFAVKAIKQLQAKVDEQVALLTRVLMNSRGLPQAIVNDIRAALKESESG